MAAAGQAQRPGPGCARYNGGVSLRLVDWCRARSMDLGAVARREKCVDGGTRKFRLAAARVHKRRPKHQDLFSSADDDFFHQVKSNSKRALQLYLPDKIDIPYKLRTRCHNMTLINKTKFLKADDYLIRMLYKYSY